jgi:hypothetical protein
MPEDAGRFMVALGAIVEHAATGRILLLKRSATADFSGGIWEHITGRGPSGISVGNRVTICHDPDAASRASRASRGACGAPGPRAGLVA